MIENLLIEKGKLIQELEWSEDTLQTRRKWVEEQQKESRLIRQKITRLESRIDSLKKAGAGDV